MRYRIDKLINFLIGEDEIEVLCGLEYVYQKSVLNIHSLYCTYTKYLIDVIRDHPHLAYADIETQQC